MAKATRIRTVDKTKIGGWHNDTGLGGIVKRDTYQNNSTVWITPAVNCQLDAQVVFQSWDVISKPMNTPVLKTCIANGEVADAYNAAVDLILKDKRRWTYMLTVEVDNMPPPDGLVKLYENMDKYDAIGGLYWTKGENGSPMIYGDPSVEDDYAPLYPKAGVVQPCNALGMGFTLFKMEMFRNIDRPWFDTAPEYTQDMYFFKKAKKAGYKFASDNRVRVGHIDFETRKIW